MSYDIILKKGDTRNCLKMELINSAGSPVDLSDCQVEIIIRSLLQKFVVVREAHIENASKGEIWHVWQPGDTDLAGPYRLEVRVVYPDGKVETFPNSSYVNLEIMPDLEGGY